ncbi:hypothetical protein FKM82_004948 [Ascaphus truei]
MSPTANRSELLSKASHSPVNIFCFYVQIKIETMKILQNIMKMNYYILICLVQIFECKVYGFQSANFEAAAVVHTLYATVAMYFFLFPTCVS